MVNPTNFRGVEKSHTQQPPAGGLKKKSIYKHLLISGYNSSTLLPGVNIYFSFHPMFHMG